MGGSRGQDAPRGRRTQRGRHRGDADRLGDGARHAVAGDGLVEVVALGVVALQREQHRRGPAEALHDVEHVQPVERELQGDVLPGEVREDDVVAQVVGDRGAHLALVDGHRHQPRPEHLAEGGRDDPTELRRDQHPNSGPVHAAILAAPRGRDKIRYGMSHLGLILGRTAVAQV